MARATDRGAGAAPAPLKLSRTLHATRATAFEAWSDAAQLQRWFAPAGYTVPQATVQMRVGGAFDVCMRSPSGEEHWTRGRIVEVVPPSRLVIDMRVVDAAGRALFRAFTEMALSDVLGGTRLDIVQTYTLEDPVTAAPMVNGAPQGWRSTLDQLEAEVVRRQGGAGIAARSVVHGEFHLARTYAAPVARVWHALTDESAKQKWFAGTPGRWTLIERLMEVRVGGRELLKGRWEGGVVSTFDAVYLDVIPEQRLIYSYQMFLDDKKISVSLATLELVAVGEQTTLKLAEQGAFLDGYEDAGSRERGTGSLLEALGVSLTDL